VRRRERSSVGADGVPPAELVVGACIEVWAADCRDGLVAYRRHRDARRAWCDERAMRGEAVLRVGGGSPWSVEFMIAQGRREVVVERLARTGVTLADIPALRAAAMKGRSR